MGHVANVGIASNIVVCGREGFVGHVITRLACASVIHRPIHQRFAASASTTAKARFRASQPIIPPAVPRRWRLCPNELHAVKVVFILPIRRRLSMSRHRLGGNAGRVERRRVIWCCRRCLGAGRLESYSENQSRVSYDPEINSAANRKPAASWPFSSSQSAAIA